MQQVLDQVSRNFFMQTMIFNAGKLADRLVLLFVICEWW